MQKKKLSNKIFSGLLIIMFLMVTVPATHVSGVQYPTNPRYRIADILPRIYQPIEDVNNGNGIYKVYWSVEQFSKGNPSYSYGIEVSIVWHDEDKPGDDIGYDNERIISYGSIRDIETFYIYIDWSGYVTHLYFPSVYSGSASWNTGAHYTSDYYHAYYSYNPAIWVNTWNHAMSWTDTNGKSDIAYTPSGTGRSSYPYAYYEGTRQYAESQTRNGVYQYTTPGSVLHVNQVSNYDDADFVPTLASAGTRIYMVTGEYSNRNTDFHFWMSTNNGISWSYLYELTRYYSYAPEITYFDGWLYMAYCERSSDDLRVGRININDVTDSSKWDFTNTNIECQSSPALAAGEDGRIYMAWRGANSRIEIQYQYSSNLIETWYRRTTLSETTYDSPALEWYDNHIVIAWTGTDNRINFIRNDGGYDTNKLNEWGEKVTFSEKSYDGPDITKVDGDLILVCEGLDYHLNTRQTSYFSLGVKETYDYKTDAGAVLVYRSGYRILAWSSDSIPYAAYYG